HTLEQIRCQFLLFELENLLPSLSLSNLMKCFILAVLIIVVPLFPVETIRNFFAALFLASIGMLIHMHFLWNHVDILVAAVLLVVVIKTVFRYNNKTAVLVRIELFFSRFHIAPKPSSSERGLTVYLSTGRNVANNLHRPLYLGVLLRWFSPDSSTEIGFKG
ncbi:hypothetical protein HID58_083242, partial [Brassica napus]